MTIRPMIAAVVLAAACSFAGAAENPVYDSWAKHKPGTRVVLTGSTSGAGMTTDIEQAYTLLEVTPEKVVIEMKSVMTMMGQRGEQPAHRIEILASAKPAPTTTGSTAAGETKVSKETIRVAGKKVETTRTDVTSTQGGATTAASVWNTPDVPGTIVKMETKTSGAMSVETTLEATTIELK